MIIKSAEFVTSVGNVSQLANFGLDEFAFVGRSNVGKSSLINALTQLPQYFFNGAHALAGVDQYAIFFISQIVTVAAASAGQAQKLQAHRIFLLLGVQR